MRKKKTPENEKPTPKSEFDRLCEKGKEEAIKSKIKAEQNLIEASQNLAKARQNLIESNRLLTEGAKRLTEMMVGLKVQQEAEAKKRAEKTKEPCKRCMFQYSCPLIASSNRLDIIFCQLRMAILGSMTKKSWGPITLIWSKSATAKEKQFWKKKLKAYINYRTKFDSGLDGVVSSKFNNGPVGLDELNGFNMDRLNRQ